MTTLFTPTASQTEVLDDHEVDGGLSQSASTVWERFKDARAPSSVASQAAAAQAAPLQDWWAPPGDVPYLVIQGMKDEAAPVENGHLLKEGSASAWSSSTSGTLATFNHSKHPD